MAATAPSPSSRAYATQAGLTIALERALARLWPQVDPTNLAGTLPAFKEQATLLVNRFSLAAAALAGQSYMTARRSAGISSPITLPAATVPAAAETQAALGWATDALWSITPTTARPQVDQLVTAATSKVDGVSSRLVLNTGRELTVQAVTQDRRAHSWARETRPGCCSFCAMLATRGGVYRSEGTAGRNANERFIGAGDFKFHNNCHCVIVPVFGLYEPPAHARQWAADWKTLADQLGHSPSLNQWRQHFESRPVRGLPTL